jgi:glycosyltransferase involved in cell wall biosynthesis
MDQQSPWPLQLSLFRSPEPQGPTPGHDAQARVAIVTRTKDRPLLLHRALASILCQRYCRWHLYVVNDGGDRQSLETVVNEYLPAFEGRVTVLHNEASLGMEAASNRALAVAEGEYVVVHDDDDSWHPDFLAETVAFLGAPANARYVGVVANSTVVQERIAQGRIVEERTEPWWGNSKHIDFRRLLVINAFPPISFVFRRSIIDRIGFFNGDLPVLGDWEFNLRAMMLGDIGRIERSLACYHYRRQTDDAAFGNTVTSGHDQHERYNVLLRNSIMRFALQTTPELIGILQPVLHAVAELDRRVEQQVRNLEHQLGNTEHQLGNIERNIDNRFGVAEHQLRNIERRLGDTGHHIGNIEHQLRDILTCLGNVDSSLQEIRMVASWQRKMLRPVRWVWLLLLPLRRAIARLRGRS